MYYQIKNNNTSRKKFLTSEYNPDYDADLAKKLGKLLYDPAKDKNIVKYSVIGHNTKRFVKWFASMIASVETIPARLIPSAKLELSVHGDIANRSKVDTKLQALRTENNFLLKKLSDNENDEVGLDKASNDYLEKVARKGKIENKVINEFLLDKKNNPDNWTDISEKSLQNKFNNRVEELIKQEENKNKKNLSDHVKEFLADIKDSNVKSFSTETELFDTAVALAKSEKQTNSVNDVRIVGTNRDVEFNVSAKKPLDVRVTNDELPVATRIERNPEIEKYIKRFTEHINKIPNNENDDDIWKAINEENKQNTIKPRPLKKDEPPRSH